MQCGSVHSTLEQFKAQIQKDEVEMRGREKGERGGLPSADWPSKAMALSMTGSSSLGSSPGELGIRGMRTELLQGKQPRHVR